MFTYFSKTTASYKEMPNLVRQLNLFIDGRGLIRVGSKLLKDRKKFSDIHCPILLHQNSLLTARMISDVHEKLRHGGVYPVLTELRRKFWISPFFCGEENFENLCPLSAI